MWLQLQYTFAHNTSAAAVAAGSYDNIRLMSGDSQSQGLAGGLPPVHPWRHAQDAAALKADDTDSWHQFSAPCWHFAEALTDAFRAAGKDVPVLGLVATAIGGSTIEEWLDLPSQEACNYYQRDANGGELNHVLWDANIRSFLNMTVKGWLYYQGCVGSEGRKEGARRRRRAGCESRESTRVLAARKQSSLYHACTLNRSPSVQ